MNDRPERLTQLNMGSDYTDPFIMGTTLNILAYTFMLTFSLWLLRLAYLKLKSKQNK